MKVLVINSSPHMDKGNTGLILNPFVEGMEEAGAKVEILYTKKLKIKPCEGCFDCWLKHPGVCIHKDDMVEILPKIPEADILVLATPLYIDGMTGPMKNFLDRTITNSYPFFELQDGHYHHPKRQVRQDSGKIVLVSTCGFWEMDNFDALVHHIKSYCRNTEREFAGALLRPHAGSLAILKQLGRIDDVFAAAKESGMQLIREGKISPELQQKVSRELQSSEKYMREANKYFQQQLDNNKKL